VSDNRLVIERAKLPQEGSSMRGLNRTDLILGKRILKETYGLVQDGKVQLAGHECSERLRHIADEIAAEIDRLDS
jgi:hypothetical protein